MLDLVGADHAIKHNDIRRELPENRAHLHRRDFTHLGDQLRQLEVGQSDLVRLGVQVNRAVHIGRPNLIVGAEVDAQQHAFLRGIKPRVLEAMVVEERNPGKVAQRG